ncbi:MAG: HEAT repeat domain-containing protein [Armatimonadetes bacterium]|nr:HEAT repeat domain-containing protein [Armatimonadota bacterium]
MGPRRSRDWLRGGKPGDGWAGGILRAWRSLLARGSNPREAHQRLLRSLHSPGMPHEGVWSLFGQVVGDTQLVGDQMDGERLFAMLDDPVRAVRLNAALFLGRLGWPDTAPGRLRPMLESDDEERRLAAAIALGHLHDARAVETLVGALAHPDADARYAAAAALRPLGPQAVPALARLREMARLDTDRGVRSLCRGTLRHIEWGARRGRAELEAAAAPTGSGLELEAASAPEGSGLELMAEAGPESTPDPPPARGGG